MIENFLKATGIGDLDTFYKRFPTERDFFAAYPNLQAGGFSDPWQIVRTQATPQVNSTTFANSINFPTHPANQPVNPIYDYSKGFQTANTLIDLIGGIKTQSDNARISADERKKMYDLMQPISYSNPNQYGAGASPLELSGQAGGYFDTGANNNNPNVIAEQNEMFEKNGQIFHIAPGMAGSQRHEDGGTPINADRVLEATSTLPGRNESSDKLLQVKPDMAELLTGFRPARSVSHATALKKADEYWSNERERYLKKADRVLEKPNADKFALESARLNRMHAEQLPTTNKLFDSLFNHQEAVKEFHGIGNEANYAAKQEMQSGGTVGDTTKQDWNSFINYLRSRKLSGNQTLNHGNDNTAGIVDEYKKLNPNTTVTADIIPKVQQDFIDNGQSYGWQNLPLSRKDGWLGSITSAYQYPSSVSTQPQNLGTRKTISYEKLFDSNGKLSYSPVFSGNWSYNDVKEAWKDIPSQFKGVPVERRQAWEDLWTGYAPGSNASQWHKANANNPAQQQITSRLPVQATSGKSNIKVSYDENMLMQNGGQPDRKEFQLPFQWMQQTPLFDMLNLSNAPETYIEPQMHDVQLQGYSPTGALNRVNADYQSAINRLPADGAGLAAQAQLFANKARTTTEEMDRVMQYNSNINNQNVQYHQQYENQIEQNRAAALQNFNDRIAKRNAIYDTQMHADRDQWMQNLMNGWATDFAVNKLLPQMYPYYNYDGTSTGKSWKLSLPDNNQTNIINDSKGRKYEIVQKPQLIKK